MLFLGEWNIHLHHKGLFPEPFLLNTAYVMKASQAFVAKKEVEEEFNGVPLQGEEIRTTKEGNVGE